MHKLWYLNDTSCEDQVLETDVMRFLAIIGIVFWIIFSFVQQNPKRIELEKASRVKPVLQKMAVKAKMAYKPPKEQPQIDEDKQIIQPLPGRVDPASLAVLPQEQVIPPIPMEERDNQPKEDMVVPGLQLQFASLQDLISLLAEERIQIFAQVKVKGFDLIFSGQSQGNVVRFKSSSSLPEQLWEILSGREREYFIRELIQEHPAILNFPEKKFMVAFVDTQMEERLNQLYGQAQESGKSGIISISEDGQIEFEASEM